MRLSPEISSSIKARFLQSIPNAEIFLFGSRAEDTARGGDIDLLLLTEERIALPVIQKIRRMILSDIGEQRLDIVNFQKSQSHPFKDLVLESAIRL